MTSIAAVASRLSRWLILALLLVLAPPTLADPDYPAFSAPVVDAAHILSEADKAAITRKLFDLQLKTGVQFAVATVPSLGGEEIEPYANGLFRSWRIGQKSVNNGLLLLLAPNERRLRFEVGYGLEGVMTDLQAKLITRNTMVPKLKAGDAAGALKAGVEGAITVLTGDQANLPEPLKQPAGGSDNSTIIFIAVFLAIVAVVFVISRRRNRSGWASWMPIGGIPDDFSRGDSSSGGDGFSGGGGGDSGGGGSSDSY